MTIQPMPTPENWRDLLHHRFATIFPLVPTDDLKATLPSMWEAGFDPNERIVLYQGQILDGRNRLRAAIQAGKDALFSEFDGTEEEAEDYSIRKNRDRRHLTDEQRYELARKLEPYFAKKLAQKKAEMAKEQVKQQVRAAGGKFSRIEAELPQSCNEPTSKREPQARDLAAEAAGISPRSASELKRLESKFPALYAQVISGEKKLWAAVSETRPSLAARVKTNSAPNPDQVAANGLQLTHPANSAKASSHSSLQKSQSESEYEEKASASRPGIAACAARVAQAAQQAKEGTLPANALDPSIFADSRRKRVLSDFAVMTVEDTTSLIIEVLKQLPDANQKAALNQINEGLTR